MIAARGPRRRFRPRGFGFGRFVLAFVAVGLVCAGLTPASAQTGPPTVLRDAGGVAMGITPPVIGPAPAVAHAILAVGDSDLAQGFVALPELLAQHGFVAPIYDAHGNGWGLLDPLDGASALEVLSQHLAAHPDVDTVVIGFAGVCAVACGSGKLAYGSPQFYDAWDAAAAALVATVRARAASRSSGRCRRRGSCAHRRPAGGGLVQLAHAPPGGDDARGPRACVRPRVRHRRASDWTQALSDTAGQWQSQLSYDGGVHTVRLGDKVHLTEDGSRRTAQWTMATLAQIWSRPERRAPAVTRRQVAKGKRSE